MAEIDQVGIAPDQACSLSRGGEDSQQAASGMPIDAAAAESMALQLQSDACILTAESLLESQLMAPEVKAGQPLLNMVAQ